MEAQPTVSPASRKCELNSHIRQIPASLAISVRYTPQLHKRNDHMRRIMYCIWGARQRVELREPASCATHPLSVGTSSQDHPRWISPRLHHDAVGFLLRLPNIGWLRLHLRACSFRLRLLRALALPLRMHLPCKLVFFCLQLVRELPAEGRRRQPARLHQHTLGCGNGVHSLGVICQRKVLQCGKRALARVARVVTTCGTRADEGRVDERG